MVSVLAHHAWFYHFQSPRYRRCKLEYSHYYIQYLITIFNIIFYIFNHHHDPSVVHQNVHIPNLIPNLPELKGESDLRKWKSQRKLFFLSTLTLPFEPPLHFYSRHTGTPRLCLQPSEEYGWVTSFPPIYSWLKNLEAIDYDHHKNYHCNYVCHLYVFDSGLVGLPINIDGDHEAAQRGKAESQLPEKLTISSPLCSSLRGKTNFCWK